ncbi:hypothetical protein BN6_47630 [Saccharothrix espanaensis DSM 44229]|uniref:Uncharacterized protein n=1 Tax=Saccharothrix espanaensis (strain ATCC 51144 / DSM 44229 / JCM 9112 / NBRC 15066 / NRRL 15764) TaxID=1179773 RepID=K0K663_SACES|nr:hypothetical protein BN6_47630 [Saccharothrix espanaensis DSM 44229]
MTDPVIEPRRHLWDFAVDRAPRGENGRCLVADRLSLIRLG